MNVKKVVFIIPFSTKSSEYENQPQPQFSWVKPDGGKIGIWGLEWGEIMMKDLVDHYNEYICEVWQPELGADRVYSAELQDRLTTRKFPARSLRKILPAKTKEEVYSDLLVESIEQYDNHQTVFMLSVHARTTLMENCKKEVRTGKILYYNFLNTGLLMPDMMPGKKLKSKIANAILYWQKTKWMSDVHNLLTMHDNPEALSQLKKMYPDLNSFLFTMAGIDTEFWKPVLSKQEARSYMHIPHDRFIIVLSQRLVPEYQIDRFIEVLAKVRTTRDYLCYITGHGQMKYELYLKGLVTKHHLEDKVLFTGFLSDEDLRALFIAADLFAVVAYMFAGSTGAGKCMALEIPILHVTLGRSYHLLKEYDAGEYVSPTDYDGWISKLEEIINGKNIKVIPRPEIERIFSSQRVADDINIALQNLN